MRKITGLLLAVLMLTALFTGCASDEPSSAASDNSTADIVSQDSGESSTESSEDTALSGIVKTGGSTSVEKVMNALIFQFQADNGDVTVEYEPNGSGDGIKNTISGLYEIGHSSRELKTDGSEDGLDAVSYAIDGIAIVVNSGNGVEDLTTQQLADIYTGAVTNWSEVGGNDAAITVVTREEGSGTRDAFAEIIGLEAGGSNIIASASVADSTGAIQTQVSENPNAIGYMSFSDVDPAAVKTVKYEGVEISTDTLKDNTYLLKREFYLLVKTGAALTPPAQAFMDFVMSDAGQQVVADNSLLPIK